MTVARLYLMHAAEGKDATLETALYGLADHVRTFAGCQGVEVLRDIGNEKRFVFIEEWDSEEAHKAAGGNLDKAVIGPVMGALDGPPDGSYLDYLKVI